MAATTTAPLIEGGSPTIFVTDLDRAVKFYAETLGLKLAFRAGEHFAMIDAGKGCTIGLHPPGKHTPAPGRNGATQLGLTVRQPIDTVVASLRSRGTRFKERDGRVVIDDGAVKLAFFEDPDGNELYLCEVKK